MKYLPRLKIQILKIELFYWQNFSGKEIGSWILVQNMALQNETWYSTCMIGDLLMENKISTFLLQKPLKPKMPFTTLSVKSKKLRESFLRLRRKSLILRICNRKPSKKLVTDALLRTWSPRLLQQRKELKMVRSFDLKSNLSTNLRNFSKILKTKHKIFYFKRSLWKLIHKTKQFWILFFWVV